MGHTAFFYSESLLDCLSELYKSQIKGKLYRLIFRLNENINITVKTPVGDSDSEDTGMNVGQGTADGATISSVNLDNGVKEAFDDVTLIASDGESTEDNTNKEYKDMQHPVLFQDDLAKVSKSIDEAQRANNKMVDMMESKVLDFNLTKSCVIVMGEDKARKKLLNEFFFFFLYILFREEAYSRQRGNLLKIMYICLEETAEVLETIQ